MSAPAFRVTGGPGSVYADLGSLEAVAQRQRDNGDLARRAGQWCTVLGLDLVSPARTAPSAEVLRDRLEDGRAGLERLAERLEDMRRSLEHAAQAYRQVESGNAAMIGLIDPALAGVPEVTPESLRDGATASETAGVISEELRAAQEKAYVDAAQRLLLALVGGVPGIPESLAALDFQAKQLPWWHPAKHAWNKGKGEAVDRVTGALPAVVEEGVDSGVLPTATAQDASREIARVVVSTGALPRGEGEVRVEPGARDRPAPPLLDGRASTLLSLVPEQDGADGAGAVTVTRVDRPDGRGGTASTWIVGLPGTTMRGGAGDNPFDALGIVESLADEPGVTRAVQEALEREGVPHGSTVVLAGYSQGGMRALDLAADEQFASAYRVEGVLTAGAPASDAAAPAEAAVLQFASEADLIWGLGGGHDRPGASRATVMFDAPAQVPLPEPEEIDPRDGLSEFDGALAGHARSEYARLIEGFERAPAQDRAEVADLQARLALLTGGAVVSSRVLTLRRTSTEPAVDQRAREVREAAEAAGQRPGPRFGPRLP